MRRRKTHSTPTSAALAALALACWTRPLEARQMDVLSVLDESRFSLPAMLVGDSLTSPGDLDGDGELDLIVGGPGSGIVFMLLMNADGTVRDELQIDHSSFPEIEDTDRFGIGLAANPSAGMPGERWSLAVGASGADAGGLERGAVVLLDVDASGAILDSLIFTPAGVLDGEDFGYSVEWIGDIDNNGRSDLAVGALSTDAPGKDRVGAVWIVTLDLNGMPATATSFGDGDGGITLNSLDRFGTALSAMQLDADPEIELAVGAAASAGDNLGSVWIVQLDAAGQALASNQILPPTPGMNTFGSSLALLGDLNADGTLELAVGAQQDSMLRGALWILSLSSSGMQTNLQKIPAGPGDLPMNLSANDAFGSAVTVIGQGYGPGPATLTLAVGGAGAAPNGAVWLLGALPADCIPGTDCNANGVDDACDLSAGTSLDCNTNGILDECDIGAGTSVDCNGNGVPDECEPDCNMNAVADSCDIAAGTSGDCDGSGVPDECEIASGQYMDCNMNGVPDPCDIATGTSIDCDEDGEPDECQPGSKDCDNNGSPDPCTDCNQNGIRDTCDMVDGTPLIEITGLAPGSPTTAPTTGGMPVTFEGRFLLPDTLVRFETAQFSIEAPVLSVAPDFTSITVIVPPFPPGPDAAGTNTIDVDVLVSRAGCAEARLSDTGGSLFPLTVDALYVDDDEPDGGDGSLASPFSRIQDAVDAAAPGHALRVFHGLYQENVVAQGAGFHSITLTSEDVTAPASTRIRGGDDFTPLLPALTLDAIGPNVVVTGFEIHLGNVGVLIRNGATPWIVRNRIDKNIAMGPGGGIRIEDLSAAVIERNLFAFNQSGGAGAGIALIEGSSALVLDNAILVNESLSHGGGVSADTAGLLVLGRNRIQQNEALGSGGGLHLDVRGGLTLFDNEVRQNEAGQNGGGIHWADSGLALGIHQLFGHLVIGNLAGGVGGGIHLGNAVGEPMAVSLLANEFSDNEASGNGAGVYLTDLSDVDMHLNRISGNTSEMGSGGGIHCTQGALTSIRNNLIEGNHVRHCLSSGGGILVGPFTTPLIENNIIKDNRAQTGGGITCLPKSRPEILRNVVAFNQVSMALMCEEEEPPPFHAPGILAQDQDSIPGPEPILFGNTVHGNASSAGGGETGGIHGIRLGFGEPDWNDNLLTLNEDWGVFCDGVNTGVRIEFNAFRDNPLGMLNPDAEDLFGGPFEGNVPLAPGDPLYLDADAGDFILDPSSAARVVGGMGFAGALVPDGILTSATSSCVVDAASTASAAFPSGFVASSTEVYLQIVHLAADSLPSRPVSMALDLRLLPGAAPFPAAVELALPLRRGVALGSTVYLHRWDGTSAILVAAGQVAQATCGGEVQAVFTLSAGTSAGVFVGLELPQRTHPLRAAPAVPVGFR